jgi:hypothetical protein
VFKDGCRSSDGTDFSTHRTRVIGAQIGKTTLSESQIKVQLVEAV